MVWLVSGIALWSTIHFVPSAIPGIRQALIARLGATLYSGLFALIVVIGLIMIVAGWRSAIPVALYAPPAWGPGFAFLLMIAAIILFGAAHAKTNIKRFIRHPQLTGLVLWSVAHIMSNGDARSLVLFGGMGVWAVLQISLINHREGEWNRPAPAALKSEVISASVGIVVFLVLVALHPYFAGVSPIPR